MGGAEILQKITEKSHELELLVIMDSKIADIGSTNDAWIAHWADYGFDAVTIAPYAGNIENAIENAHAHNLGARRPCASKT